MMDKKQLRELMPRDKNDAARAHALVALGYPAIQPVVQEMLRWLRTCESPVAEVFIAFFAAHGPLVAGEVRDALRSSRQGHWKYVVVTRVLSEWSRPALEQVASELAVLMTHSEEPEMALMALKLLAQQELMEKEGLKQWLDFIADRMERNLTEARQIAAQYW
jgi:hypothetical protein